MKCLFGSSQQAFTLVELIVVTAVLGVLAAMAIPQFSKYRDKAKGSAAASDIRALEKTVIAYALDKGNLPTTLGDAGITQLDPWQKPYGYWAPGISTVPIPDYPAAPLEYSVSGTGTLNMDFDLYSKGADGSSSIDSSDATSVDDFVRSNDGGFAGTRAGL